MLKEPKYRAPGVVELAEGIRINLDLPQDNHAALRAGFAGYPVNPRWNVTKFRAWKKGKQLREALIEGKLGVRSTDSMLVPLSELEQRENPSSSSSRPLWSHVPLWARQLISSYQTT